MSFPEGGSLAVCLCIALLDNVLSSLPMCASYLSAKPVLCVVDSGSLSLHRLTHRRSALHASRIRYVPSRAVGFK
uniref:Putative secreted peptide n=1 Tax=Anopheles braziliensis TaxID=58242 RepID=A0A2M3ZR08_9DIPT